MKSHKGGENLKKEGQRKDKVRKGKMETEHEFRHKRGKEGITSVEKAS